MATTTSTRIGFVGLGHMGGSAAARFLAAGYPVFGEERNRAHAQELVDAGLQWRNTPREVARATDIVFTSLPDDGVLEAGGSGPPPALARLPAREICWGRSPGRPPARRQLSAPGGALRA